MNHDGDLVTRVLAERAERVAAPGVGLAGRARSQARARRRHQGLGALAAAAVATAAALGAAALPGADHRAVVPADRGGISVSLAVPDGATTVIDQDRVAAGAAPAVSWWAWRALHRSDGRVVRLPDAALGVVGLPDGGALVTGGTESDPTLTLVSADGRTHGTFAASEPVVAQDGQVAFVDLDQQEIVRIAADGWAARTAVAVPRRGLRLVGFLGTSVVADTAAGPPLLVQRDGTAEPLPGEVEATASDGPTRTVASRSADRRCLELRRDGRRLWHSCSNRGGFTSIVAISPDGHRVLLRRDTSGNAGSSEYAVAVAETGQVLRLLAAGGSTLGLGQATFEDSRVLVVAYRDAEAGIVRCDEDGACGLAADDVGAGPAPFAPVWFP